MVGGRLLAGLVVALALVTGTAEAADAAVPGTREATPSGADLCAQVGAVAGFPAGGALVTAVAVALAESSCVASARGANGPTAGCPNGSVDRGLWQVNSCYHAEVSDSCAYNAQCNANAARRISAGGTNWTPWSTYNSGAYRAYLATAQAAVNRLATGTILASPTVNVRAGPHRSAGVVGQAGYGDSVRITCWTYGDEVGEGFWPSAIWDSIVDARTGGRPCRRHLDPDQRRRAQSRPILLAVY